LKAKIPEHYDYIEVYCDSLPFNDAPEARPFTGIVVNFCVSTDGHRDTTDILLCVVIPFGRWEGGELVLHELGLVLKLHPGDVVVFPSGKITHFNLHFTGERGSVVLHSDGRGDRWLNNRNGWGNHILAS
jgi:hypothetical protein